MPSGELAYIINLGGAHPGHPLPEPPTYPTTGPVPPGGAPSHPSHPIVVPPPGFWPPPPTIDNGLPYFPPGYASGQPIVPGVPIYPDNSLPTETPFPPGLVWPPVDPSFGNGLVMALVIVFGVGYRWAVLDLSLKPAPPIATTPSPK